jgi:hypothetical protein
MKGRKAFQDKIVYRPIPDLATFSAYSKKMRKNLTRKYNKIKK